MTFTSCGELLFRGSACACACCRAVMAGCCVALQPPAALGMRLSFAVDRFACAMVGPLVAVPMRRMQSRAECRAPAAPRLLSHCAPPSAVSPLVVRSHVPHALLPPPRTTRFVLLKERTRLHGEKLLYRSQGERMPDPSRIGRVRKSMARIKQARAVLPAWLPAASAAARS